MPKTLFSPAQHGFRFANYFENVIFEESPFGRIATRGRCGGMAFAALDHYYAGLALPNVTQRNSRRRWSRRTTRHSQTISTGARSTAF